MSDAVARSPGLRLSSSAGTWTLVACVLGSAVAFLDGTVVSVALPTMAEDLDVGFDTLQWVTSAYLLTLGSLVLVGGGLGDRYGRRRIYLIGLTVFCLASVACGLAPSGGLLIAGRAVQGVGAALLTPTSLGMLQAVYVPEDRGRAVGLWSGWSGISTLFGPFLGGWLVDWGSWRLVFFINVPLIALAAGIAMRFMPETRDPASAGRSLDLGGACLATAGLALFVYPLIETDTAPGLRLAMIAVALVLFVALWWLERRVAYPMLPPILFRSRTFTWLNVYTIGVYAALAVMQFILTVYLQTSLGYSALEAGAASVPITVLLLFISPRSGAIASRRGPRDLLVAGALVTGLGMALLSTLNAGDSYLLGVLPGVIVLGVGLSLLVAPLTSGVLTVAGPDRAGVAGGVSNAVARVAALVAIAVVPAVAGIAVGGTPESLAVDLADGYAAALLIAAALCLASAILAAVTLRQGPVEVASELVPGPD